MSQVLTLLEIDIKAEHIAKASLAKWMGDGYPLACPLVQAILSVFPGYEVEVRGDSFGLRETSTGKESYGTLTKGALALVEAWDTFATRATVQPCKVHLRCPFTLIPST